MKTKTSPYFIGFIMGVSLTLLVGIVWCPWFFINKVMPVQIEQRFNDLGLLHFRLNEMGIPCDTSIHYTYIDGKVLADTTVRKTTITQGDYFYIKYGTTKNK